MRPQLFGTIDSIFKGWLSIVAITLLSLFGIFCIALVLHVVFRFLPYSMVIWIAMVSTFIGFVVGLIPGTLFMEYRFGKLKEKYRQQMKNYQEK